MKALLAASLFFYLSIDANGVALILMKAPEKVILNTKVLMTFVNGEKVFESK